MSRIETLLHNIEVAKHGEDVRGSIHDAIEQCYSDVHNPTLNTEAIEAAVQTKIDEGEMAALTIGDGTITTAKIANGAITQAKLDPNISFEADAVLDETSTNAIQNKAVASAISELNGSLDSLIVPTASQWKALFDILDKAGYKETGVGAEIAVLRNALSDDNIFDPVTAIKITASYIANDNKLRVSNSSNGRMAAIQIEAGKTYKVSKSVSAAFRVIFIASTPVQPTGSTRNEYSVLYTEANHTGTEITAEAPSGATYMCIHYANGDSTTEQEATQILRSISVVEVEAST